VNKKGDKEILKTTVCESPVEEDELKLQVYDMSGN
jgi:hypothetical protein